MNLDPALGYKMPKKSKLTLLYCLSFLTLFIALIWYMLATRYTPFFTDPGMNTYPNMVLNLLYQHGHFFDWSMGAALYIIPDLTLLYVVALFTHNPYTILISYGAIQIALFSSITPAIFREIDSSKLCFRVGILSILGFLLILLLKHPLDSIFTIHAYLTAIFAPGYHFGGALLVFFNLFLILKLTKNPKWYLLVTLAILLFLTGLSDPLTYIYFTLPIFASLFIAFLCRKLTLKNYLILAAIVFLAALAAYITYHSLPITSQKINDHISIQLTYLVDYLKLMFQFFVHNPIAAISWLIFLIWAPISLWRSYKDSKAENWRLEFTLLYFWLSIIISTPLMIFAIGQMVAPYYYHLPAQYILQHPILAYDKLQHYPARYFINYLLGPACFGTPLLFYKHISKLNSLNNDKVFGSLLAIISLTAIIAMPYKHTTNSYLNFQPQFVRCFNNYAKKYDLVNGLSQYQLGLTLVNAYNLNKHVAYVRNDLSPFDWQTSLQMFDYKNYNFVISKTKATNAPLIQFIGEPDKILYCPRENGKRSYIFVYQNNQINERLPAKYYPQYRK